MCGRVKQTLKRLELAEILEAAGGSPDTLGAASNRRWRGKRPAWPERRKQWLVPTRDQFVRHGGTEHSRQGDPAMGHA